MKIFSNFDTQLKNVLYQQAVNKHGQQLVYAVHRDAIFLLFYIIIPAFFYVFSIVLVLLVPYLMGIEDELLMSLIYILIGVGILISFFVVGRKILKHLIDYKMDFAIITPCDITAYNQAGIFSRTHRVIDINKIKSVSVDKTGFLKSFFNFGTINIATEGDNEDSTDITLNYVTNPDFVSKEISIITTFANRDSD